MTRPFRPLPRLAFERANAAHQQKTIKSNSKHCRQQAAVSRFVRPSRCARDALTRRDECSDINGAARLLLSSRRPLFVCLLALPRSPIPRTSVLNYISSCVALLLFSRAHLIRSLSSSNATCFAPVCLFECDSEALCLCFEAFLSVLVFRRTPELVRHNSRDELRTEQAVGRTE